MSLKWELIDKLPRGGSYMYTSRARCHGGWLVSSFYSQERKFVDRRINYNNGQSYSTSVGGGLSAGTGLTFVPDPNHEWEI